MPPRETSRFLPRPGTAPRLQPNLVHALLGDLSLPTLHEMMTLKVDNHLISRFDLTRPIFSAPIDSLIVSVSKPVGIHAEQYVAGVSFRKPHRVLPSTSDGVAIFGDEEFVEEHWWHGQPFDGACAEFEFWPPRPGRYLLEFFCEGDGSIQCTGTDGSSLTSNDPFAVVLSANGNITYTLTSPNYWWFSRCTVQWLSR
jgi:hypothetical protein